MKRVNGVAIKSKTHEDLLYDKLREKRGQQNGLQGLVVMKEREGAVYNTRMLGCIDH